MQGKNENELQRNVCGLFSHLVKVQDNDQNESTLTSDEKSQIREDNLLQPPLRSNTNVENE